MNVRDIPILVVDDYSSYCWSYFLKRKDELAGELIGK
jgi:hypothetical protein